MGNLSFEGTSKIPEVILNPDGIIQINGRWIEDLSCENYNAIMDWIGNYAKNPGEITIVDISLEYFSTRNLTSFLNIFRRLICVMSLNKKLVTNWYYEAGDDEMLERGKYISSMVKMPFNFICVRNHKKSGGSTTVHN